jgi:CRP-like cAMP-binding protein
MQLVQQGEVAEIAAVGPGEFFGEAGMHGTQSADSRAVAVEDTEVLLLRPDTVRQMFEASPTLARDTGRVLDVRRRAMQSARTALRRH